jgi:hypothetical protein
MVPSATFQIYRNRAERNFRVQRFFHAPRFGHVLGWGPPLYLSEQEMRSNGYELVLREFAEFSRRQQLPDEGPRLTDGDMKKLQRDFDLVGIRERRGEIVLSPMRAFQGGFRGVPVDETKLDLPATAETFFSALMCAFQRIGGKNERS